MGHYKAYDEYKNSGVEWLGKVPAHWGVKRLGQFFEERREKVSDKDYPPLSVTMGGIVPQLENAAKTEAGDNRKLVLKNDFVINSRSDRKGSSGVSPYDGSVSLISIVMTPKNIEPKYVHHLLRSYNFQEEFYRYGKGIVADLWSTNSSEMKNILIPEMPVDEQLQIAKFLDYETAKIDELIEKQRMLIELLKEKRQAVISHAVTKGLNADAPMKGSGVDWLDVLPSHWEVLRLSFAMKLQSGDTITSDSIEADGSYLVYGGNGVRGYTTTFNCEGEFVLIGRQGALCGNINMASGKFFASEHAIVVYPRKPFNSVYLAEMLRFMNLGQYSMSAAQPGVSVERLNLLKVILPPLVEQAKIAQLIENINKKFGAISLRSEEQILLLQERRTALITAAVTGKIDVREWQPPKLTNTQKVTQSTKEVRA